MSGKIRKIIDEKRVIELAAKGYYLKEIAALENVSHDTLSRRAAKACEIGQELLKGQLRAKQVQVALGDQHNKPNPIMLIWLGKQLLQQADKQEIDVQKQVQVQMVVGINQQKLNRLTQGYFEKQLPEAIEADVVEMQQSMPESMSNSPHQEETKSE